MIWVFSVSSCSCTSGNSVLAACSGSVTSAFSGNSTFSEILAFSGIGTFSAFSAFSIKIFWKKIFLICRHWVPGHFMYRTFAISVHWHRAWFVCGTSMRHNRHCCISARHWSFPLCCLHSFVGTSRRCLSMMRSRRVIQRKKINASDKIFNSYLECFQTKKLSSLHKISTTLI